MSQATKQEKVKELLLLQNLQRIRYGFAIGALITFIHIAYFFYQLPGPDSTTHTWKLGIIIVHAFLFIVFLIQGMFVLLPGLHAFLAKSCRLAFSCHKQVGFVVRWSGAYCD